MTHDESKLPKWVQRRLRKGREHEEDARHLRAMIRDDNQKTLAYFRELYRLEDKMADDTYQRLDDAMYATPGNGTP